MQDAWDVFLNWNEMMELGGDTATYAIMAGVGTLLFGIRLVVAMFGGDGGDFDADAGAGSDASFTLFSLLSVMAFIMGTGWMGLACRIDWGLSRPLSVVIAVSFGVVMMFLASGLMFFTRRLNRTVTYDVETAVGKTAHVYMTIPAKGAGQGKVQVSVSGRLMTVNAISAGPELTAFADVRVVGTRDDETLVVEPIE
jgi:hypothetical protein